MENINQIRVQPRELPYIIITLEKSNGFTKTGARNMRDIDVFLQNALAEGYFAAPTTMTVRAGKTDNIEEMKEVLHQTIQIKNAEVIPITIAYDIWKDVREATE